MRKVRLLATGALSVTAIVLFLAGCADGSSGAQGGGTPTAIAANTPTTEATLPPPTVAPSSSPAAQITWVPPTALVGTPIPGAEATLTAAPALKRGFLTITNNSGAKVQVRVEIADTDDSRSLGLMFRSSMDDDTGMLFDFKGETQGGFWMQNTILPLSIAFIATDGTILNVEDMQPLNTDTVEAAGTYAYALEVSQGFFRAHDIVAGNKVTLPPTSSSGYVPGMPLCMPVAR